MCKLLAGVLMAMQEAMRLIFEVSMKASVITGREHAEVGGVYPGGVLGPAGLRADGSCGGRRSQQCQDPLSAECGCL